MGMDRKALLSKIAGANTSGGGNYIRDGRGRVAIKKAFFDDKHKGTTFILEALVLSSQKVPVVSLKTGQVLDVEPNPAGSEVSWVQLMEKHDSAFGNVKKLVLEAYAMGDAAVPDAELVDCLDYMTTAENPARGRVLDFETYRVVTKASGKEIVIVKWVGVEQTDEDVAKMRAYLDALATQQPAGVQAAATASA